MVEEQQGSVQAVMRAMDLTVREIDRRKRYVNIGAEDLKGIAAIKDLVVGNADEYVDAFFNYLTDLDETKALMRTGDFTQKARLLKTEHLVAMVQGVYDLSYVEQRLKLALLYSRAGLDTRIFLGAFHHLLRAIGASIMQAYAAESQQGFDHFMSLKKVAFFDIGIVADVLIYERERVIRQQQDAIRELSTPVLQIRERLLLLPIIGVIDTHRARLVTDGLLKSIRANRAKVVVMDVTGVATIDSRVANHLIQTVTAARLMGALVIVTGISSEVAQSLVALGIELARFNTVGDLQGGLEEAERILGYRVVQQPASSSISPSA